jgi:hypothetical protein
MPFNEPSPIRVWAGVTLFFGIGVALAIVITLAAISRGDSQFVAIFAGALAGGCGAWFVFFVVLNMLKQIRALKRGSPKELSQPSTEN